MTRSRSSNSRLLDQSIVKIAKPRKRIFDIKDTEIPGYTLRIWPSGHKSWCLAFRHKGQMIKKTLGNAMEVPEIQARQMAIRTIKDIRLGVRVKPLPTAPAFEKSGAYLLEHYSRHWKPTTKGISERCFESHILPYFRGRDIDTISRGDVLAWFASMADKPGAANRCLPLLSVLMEQAELYGYRPDNSNPCRRIRRYRLKVRERFLSDAEMARLGEILRRHETRRPAQIAMLRLVMLTGCRKSEILNLQWVFYREGHLHLPDSKTGPKTILLSTPARDILDNWPRRRKFIFSRPGQRKPFSNLYLWYEIRKEAGLEGVRIHDLRHSYASFAIRQGVALGTVGRLLGHQDSGTTLQYIHLCDDNLLQSAQAVGDAMGFGREI